MPYLGKTTSTFTTFTTSDANVTDDLTVTDDASVGGDLAVTGTTTLTGNTAIGHSSATAALDVRRGDAAGVVAEFHNTSGFGIDIGTDSDSVAYVSSGYTQAFAFKTNAGSGQVERMRIDSSGNVLVGHTSVEGPIADGGVGISLKANGQLYVGVAGTPFYIHREGSDGDFAEFRKDGTAVGKIGSSNSGIELFICGSASTCSGVFFNVNGVLPMVNGSVSDNTEDLGQADLRWDDVHATNGTIQTSDENEKQDIAFMTTAELAVGKSISALFKTFRWKDKVTSKGNNARTHSGIIAQQVKAAFEAESLDATKYALFCSDTWWEHDVNVDAVEADETADPPIEAVDAYTRTDKYYTEDNAPSGATQKTRMGIRYPELLSFLASYNDHRFTAIETRLTALEDA